MPKRLVVCCDGTWNTPDGLNNGQPAPTNVTKLALALSSRDAAGVEQRMFYHRGVGTRRSERLRGGAFGFGLSREIGLGTWQLGRRSFSGIRRGGRRCG
jgi:uncharacterized protein (DUF2235 family)